MVAKPHLTYKQALDYIYSFTDYEKKSVYRVHSPACCELVARIEATDRLVDQIVYKLYGLTEEERKIVEEEGR